MTTDPQSLEDANGQEQVIGPKTGFRVWLLIVLVFVLDGGLLWIFLTLRQHLFLSTPAHALMELSYWGPLIFLPLLWIVLGWFWSRPFATEGITPQPREAPKALEGIWFLAAFLPALSTLYLFRQTFQEAGVLGAYRYPAEYAVSIVILCPISEEIVFRRLLFGYLAGRKKILSAALLSSVIFALAHFGSYPFPIIEFLGGMIFCGLYLWRKTLVAPIAAHIGANLAKAIIENYLLN